MTRDELIEAAIGVNEGYRGVSGDDDRDLEVGFLYGTAELILVLTFVDGESYHDSREAIAAKIDKGAKKNSYPLLPCNGYKPEKE